MWRDRPNITPSVRSRIVGQPAFITIGKNGYLSSRVGGKNIYAHQAAWVIIHSSWPSGDIDHINGDRADNCILNLRDVTRSENSKNAKKSSANTSGVTGVVWHKGASKWASQIMVSGKNIYLGLFDDIHEAATARRSAEREFGFHENHGRQS